MDSFGGIDVGADRVHCVRLREADITTRVFGAGDIDAVLEWMDDAECIAIDSPDRLSTGKHENDLELGAKFRSGRCAEVALGREHRLWVPWVTPRAEPVPPWMGVGFTLFAAFLAAGRTCIEVYPHACFHRLAAGGRLANKRSAQGSRQRVDLLWARGFDADHVEMWSHDAIDAAVAALTAADWCRGTAVGVTCGHDDSRIWLPNR